VVNHATVMRSVLLAVVPILASFALEIAIPGKRQALPVSHG
jgi:hypothetical protein